MLNGVVLEILASDFNSTAERLIASGYAGLGNIAISQIEFMASHIHGCLRSAFKYLWYRPVSNTTSL